MVRKGGDGTERLGGLRVSQGLTSRGVHAGIILVFRIAHLENADLRCVWACVTHANAIVNMLAEVSGVWVGRIANLQARGVRADEALTQYIRLVRMATKWNILVPLDNLGERVVVAGPALRQVVRIHQASKRVATLQEVLVL